jgi:hypothetical protein
VPSAGTYDLLNALIQSNGDLRVIVTRRPESWRLLSPGPSGENRGSGETGTGGRRGGYLSRPAILTVGGLGVSSYSL